MSFESKTGFRPVRGEEEQILATGYNEGWVYFATDTGKIFLDAHGKEKIPMGGSGASLFYSNAPASHIVENPEGTATDMKVSGVTIAGKTGTAELKTSSTDTESGTLGWFDCFTVDNPSGNDMLIISMVENTQNNRDGGSHYLIKKIRTLFVK